MKTNPTRWAAVSITAAFLMFEATVLAQQTAHHGTQSAGVLTTPSSIQAEHEHLHHGLTEAVAAGGETATAAKKVEAVLMPHFAEEEQYAMPPLSLLQSMAAGQEPTEAQAHEAIQMTDKLRENYSRMLAEHKEITAALEHLAAAAKQENKPRQAQFAEGLILHAQNEEQILYPAALVLGDYLKLKMSNAHAASHEGA